MKVDVRNVLITVETWDVEKFQKMIDPTDYLSDLKGRLEFLSVAVPERNQRIFFQSKECGDDIK